MSFMIFQNEKTPFQGIKTKSPKNRKIAIFPKGLTHGFGPKIALLPTLFFQAIQARKLSFIIVQNQNTPFKAIKSRSPKSQKIDLFPKEFGHVLGPKMAIFPSFFSQAIQARKMFFMIFQNEKTPFQAIKTKLPKSRKLHIFPKAFGHVLGPKMAIFPTLFSQAIQARKMSFMIFQNKSTPFQALKTKSPKSRIIEIYPKGLTHGFGPKITILPIFFFLGNIGHKMSFMIFQKEKTPFQAIKRKIPKS